MYRVIITFCFLVVSSFQIFGQTQRMSVIPGNRRVSPGESIRIEAFCLDETRTPPNQNTIMSHVIADPGHSVIEFQGRNISLRKAIEEGTIKIYGGKLSLMDVLEMMSDSSQSAQLDEEHIDAFDPLISLYRMTPPDKRKKLSDLFSLPNLFALYKNDNTRDLLPDEFEDVVLVYEMATREQRGQLEKEWDMVASLLLDELEARIDEMGDHTSLSLSNETAFPVTVKLQPGVVVGATHEQTPVIPDLMSMIRNSSGNTRRHFTAQRTIWSAMNRERQRMLQFLGYYDGDITGEIDSRCKRSLRGFQKDMNLTPDGKFNPSTEIALFEEFGKFMRRE